MAFNFKYRDKSYYLEILDTDDDFKITPDKASTWFYVEKIYIEWSSDYYFTKEDRMKALSDMLGGDYKYIQPTTTDEFVDGRIY